MKRKSIFNTRGEVVTLLAIGALIVLGVTTLVSTVFLPKKNTSNTKAEISWTCVGDGIGADDSVKATFIGVYKTEDAASNQWLAQHAKAKNQPVSWCTGGSSTTASGSTTTTSGNPKCDDMNWYCAGECASQAVRNTIGNSQAWRDARLLNCKNGQKEPPCTSTTSCNDSAGGSASSNNGSGKSNGVAGCFHLEVNSVADPDPQTGGYKFNFTVRFVSNGGDGDIQLQQNGRMVAGWNGWNSGGIVGNAYTYIPRWTGSPVPLKKGDSPQTITYTGLVANSERCPGVRDQISCTISVGDDNKPSSTCGSDSGGGVPTKAPTPTPKKTTGTGTGASNYPTNCNVSQEELGLCQLGIENDPGKTGCSRCRTTPLPTATNSNAPSCNAFTFQEITKGGSKFLDVTVKAVDKGGGVHQEATFQKELSGKYININGCNPLKSANASWMCEVDISGDTPGFYNYKTIVWSADHKQANMDCNGKYQVVAPGQPGATCQCINNVYSGSGCGDFQGVSGCSATGSTGTTTTTPGIAACSIVALTNCAPPVKPLNLKYSTKCSNPLPDGTCAGSYDYYSDTKCTPPPQNPTPWSDVRNCDTTYFPLHFKFRVWFSRAPNYDPAGQVIVVAEKGIAPTTHLTPPSYFNAQEFFTKYSNKNPYSLEFDYATTYSDLVWWTGGFQSSLWSGYVLHVIYDEKVLGGVGVIKRQIAFPIFPNNQIPKDLSQPIVQDIAVTPL